MTDRIKYVKEMLMCAVEGQLTHLDEVDAEELGEVVDMIKDFAEAEYYCAVVKAMEESEKYKEEEMIYYPPMYYGGRSGDHSNWKETGMTDWRDERRYYGGNNGNGRSGSSSNANSNGNYQGNSGGSQNSPSYYTEKEFPHAFDDPREGRSYRSRRMYMESKETHQDKTAQMKELEKYAQELTQDIVEMVEGASAEEKQYLSKKVAALANKITQLTPNG